MPTAYATVEDLRQLLDQVAPTAEREALLRACLTRARSTVDRELRFSFWGVDVDTGEAEQDYPAAAARTVYRAPGPGYLVLPPYAAGSITAVATSGGTAIDAADWTEDWGAGTFVLRHTDGTWASSAYTVTAAWGVGPAPETIVDINLRLAVNLWRARAKGGFSELGGGQGGAVIRTVAALSDEDRRLIARVRRDYGMVGGP